MALHLFPLPGLKSPATSLRASGPVLLGGSFLMIADSFARSVVAPLQLPVGVVTAIIGVPTFLLILRRSQRRDTEQ